MKRTIVVAAVLLASALSAHAAPVKKHVRVVNRHAACHEVVVTGDDAVRYALGVASGTIPLPSVQRMQQCYTYESPGAYARDNPDM